MRNPGQSDGCTGQSEVESVNSVHTPFCPRSIDPCPNDTAVRRAVIHRRRYRLAVQYESNPFTAAESGRRLSRGAWGIERRHPRNLSRSFDGYSSHPLLAVWNGC